MSAEGFARIAARVAELRALTPDPRDGVHPVTEAAAETARSIARAVLAMGHKPHMFPVDEGGCTVECDPVDVHISADGRVASVVTLAEGDEDSDG